ncbi:MAG: IS3 family transposase [Nitrospinae bacterium]|nr:IS3 family transposase [Nitrospinota bacterium]
MRLREISPWPGWARFGYRRIHVLLRREGWVVNRKRVHRI